MTSRLGAITCVAALAIATLAVSSSALATSSDQHRNLPGISIADASARESDGAITFEVRLDKPSSRTVQAWYYTRQGSALAWKDFVWALLPVRIPAGETTASVNVRLLDDDLVEGDEIFTVKLVFAFGARPGDRTGVGTIIDDDFDPLTINILHINDHHSHLQPDSGDVDLDTSGGEFDYELGGFPQVVAKFNELSAELDNVVKVHAGDAITGTLFYSLFSGEADAALMNEVCFDAFTLGNHEFDDSDAGLAQFLTWLAAGDCDTPVLGANVVPQVGTPLAPNAVDDFIQPFVIKEFDGQKVAFIGINIAQKTTVSSSPLPTTQFLDEVETTQRYVDELAAMGIHNVVLITHFTYENDLNLATQVTGVDAIVDGDSHTLLGDFGPFNLNTIGPYPTRTVNADGDPVCVVQAWQYAYVVGEFNITFDDGKNVDCGGTPHLLVGNFSRDRTVVDENGDVSTVTEPVPEPELSEIVAAIADIPTVDIAEADPEAQELLDSFASEVDILAQMTIGTATEDLCLERIPGEGRSAICALNETSASGAVSNINGGFIQQIVTDAYLARAFRADIALQNAGGVRIDIAAGEISIADAFELLPFSNTLVELELTGAEIVQVLEEAVANFADNGGSTGSYPYGSAIRWDVDLGAASGARFSNVEIRADDGSWSAIDTSAIYIVVTNSFIASGQDGYLTFGTAFDEGRVVDTLIDYTQGFIDWLEQDVGGVITVPNPSDFSTQNFTPAPP